LTTDHQRRVRELFDAALDQPAELRRQFLAGACKGDERLMETVGRLLAAQERSAGVLDTPVWQRRETAANPGEPGSFIGPYKVLQELGGGGMGIVYQAVRADEVFQRICAIKVIRPEISTDTLLQRFRQERQILARLDHLNIARIVDGGSTASGLPYFVMDFVDGPPITKFCAEHDLTTRPRLSLFRQVCDAVQYLHQKGVIHGDLKPPNILVGNDGAVKLVDFGIASALSAGEGQDKALPLMTPGYASPEQMQGKPLSATSDVYSLGVILYELLTGAQPFPGTGRGRLELLNIVTSQDPTLPSIAVNSSPVLSQREVRHELKGDLDAIVLRAMQRDPARRYRSVAELNADIGRYLESRPVSARNIGLVQRGKKFLARNRNNAVAGFVICVLLATCAWEGVEMHRREVESRHYQEVARQALLQGQNNLKANEAELARKSQELHAASPGEAKTELMRQFQDSQVNDVRNLAETYRKSFSEAVRLWPGMTRERRDMLDQTDRYLHEAEPFIGQDPKASEQLASAWLWLANLQGNPETVNLHDRSAAETSIHEAQRILEKSPGVTVELQRRVERAALQIEYGK
jgi:serine/threonine protein kinase